MKRRKRRRRAHPRRTARRKCRHHLIRNARGLPARRVSMIIWKRALWSVLRSADKTGVCVVTEQSKACVVAVSLEYFRQLSLSNRVDGMSDHAV